MRPPTALGSVVRKLPPLLLSRAARTVAWARQPDQFWRLLTSALLGLGFLGLVLFYTRGALLYGDDFPGAFSPWDLLIQPHPDYLLFALGDVLGLGNIYVGFYVGLFLGTFATTWGCQFLARELFHPGFGKGKEFPFEALAALLYLFVPLAVTWNYESLVKDLDLSRAAFFLFLGLLARSWRELKAGGTLSMRTAVLLGLASAFANEVAFPDDVRAALLEGLGILGVILFAYLRDVHRGAPRGHLRASFVRIVTVALPIALPIFLLDFYWFYSVLGYSSSSIGALVTHYGTTLGAPNYDPFSSSLRLLVVPEFPTQAYAAWYAQNGWVVAGSYLWPLLALLAAPLAAVGLRVAAWRRVLVVEMVLGVGIVWDSGTNPPTGAADALVLHLLPGAFSYFPPGRFGEFLGSKIFPVLAAFVLVQAAILLRGRGAAELGPPPEDLSGAGPRDPAPRGRRRARLARPARGVMAGAVVVAVVALLMVGDLPLLEGDSLHDAATGSPGFSLPSSYLQVRSILNDHDSGALLLPAIRNYVTTQWGYDGASELYSDLFYPSAIVVPHYFGTYTADLPKFQAIYSNSTQVIAPSAVAAPVNATWTQGAPPNANFSYFDTYTAHAAVSLAGDAWLEISTTVEDPYELQSEIRQNAFQVIVGDFLIHQSYTYVPGNNHAAVVTWGPGGNLTIDLWLDPSGKVGYNGTLLHNVILAIPGTGSVDPGVGPISVNATVGSSVSPAWRTQVQGYGVSYILVDGTLRTGFLDDPAFSAACVAALLSSGLATPVYASGALQLYRLT